MTLKELKAQIALGENSRRQFKRDVTNADSLAAEMAAFANSEGGTIYPWGGRRRLASGAGTGGRGSA